MKKFIVRSFSEQRVEKAIKMQENGESFRTNSSRELKSDKSDLDSKMKSSSPDEKFTLPSIHPTVIQALPSGQQALPSLQPTDPLSLPKIKSKGRKARRRPKSGVRRMLPSIPTVEKLTLPSIQANAATSVKQTLPILPTIEEQAKPSTPLTETKLRSAVRSVRRILPSIPPTEQLTLPSIEPTAVKAQPKIIFVRRRRRLPILLPTIIEQPSPEPAEVDANEADADPAENDAPKNPEAKAKDGQAGPQSVVEETQKSLQPVEQEARPNQTKELQNVKPKQKAAKQRPPKVSKGTQTNLQSAEVKVMPSLKPQKENLPENSGTKVEELPRAPSMRKIKEAQSSDRDILSSVQEKEKRVPQPPTKKAVLEDKPLEKKSPPKPQPQLEKVLPRRPMTRSARATRQMAKAKELSVPPLKLEHDPTGRRMKRDPQATKAEPLSSIKGKVKQIQTMGEALLSPQHAVEQKLPRPPAARRMKLSPQGTEVPLASVQGKMRQTERKAEALLSPQHAVEQKIPRPPAERRMKFSPQATHLEPLESVQRTVMHDPRPPPVRRTEVSLQTAGGETLESVQETVRQAKSPQGTLEHNFPMPPAAKQTKASPTVRETEAVPCLPPRKKETPPPPKPGSYAFLNLKRREFEELQRVQLMAKQYPANVQPAGKGKHSRDLLTVKPALPAIQPTQEEAAAAMLKPHPPGPMTRKGMPSARPTVKRPHPKFRAILDRELPSLQPTVKQALPSISSSNLHTLVKQPLPSVQPEERFTEELHGHLPGEERQ